MSDWCEATLGEVLTLQRGFDITKNEQRAGRVPVVSSSGIGSYHDEAKVGAPGVVIGRKGSLGTVFYVDQPFWPHDTTLWVKDFKGNDPYFCHLLLRVLPLADLDGGAANPTLNRNHAHALNVRVPNPATQRRIAAVLRAFDELIAINERRIEVLEGLARSLYREWFVRFRATNGAPAGWQASTLSGVTTHVSRGVSPKYSEDGEWIVFNQRCVRHGRVSVAAARRHAGEVSEPKRLRRYDVLVNSTGVGTLGRVGQFLLDLERVTTDSHVSIVRPAAPEMRHWLGLQLIDRQSELEAMGAGSTGQTELSRDRLGELKLLLPPSDLLRRFSSLIDPMMAAAGALLAQNIALESTRDLLLPRLVTGRTDIGGLDLGGLLPEAMG